MNSDPCHSRLIVAAGTRRTIDQSRTGDPEARKDHAYPLFDWLRFFLASIVVLGHEKVELPGPIDASLAVSVFLALSGWLIGGILLRSAPADLPRFYFNRATRIWMPYLAAFTLIYGLAALRSGVDFNWLKYAFYDLTFTHITWTRFPQALHELPLQGTGNHFWSISVEEQFYLFAPPLMMARSWGKQLKTWLFIGAGLLSIGSVFAPIALGVAAAVVQLNYGDWQQKRLGIFVAVMTAAALFGLLLAWDTPQLRALFSTSCVVALAQQGRRQRIGLFVGAISYPLYLNHWIGTFAVSFAAKHVEVAIPIQHAAAYVLAIATAVISWALIDRPVMAHRSRWFTRGRGLMLSVIAYGLLLCGLLGGALLWWRYG